MKSIKRIIFALVTLVMPLSNSAMALDAYNFGDPSPGAVKAALETFKPEIESISGTIMAIALYVSIIIIGINIIIYRNKPDERTSAMTGLLYIAIGTLIFTSAYFICGLLLPGFLS